MRSYDVETGKTFKIGNIPFIKFPSKDESKLIAVAKEIAFKSRFGDNNDIRQSDVLRKLNSDFLPRIEDIVGKENI